MCPYGRAGKLGDSRFLDRSYILWRSINLSKGSQNTILRRAKRIVRYVNIYQHLQRGAKWFRFRVSIHHPLGFNWHPFAGPGIWFYMNTHVWLGPVCVSATSSPQLFLFSKKVKYEIDAKKWTQKKIQDIFLLDNLFHFRISSLIFKILCQVFQPEFSRAKSSGVLDSCNKNGLLKSHLFTRGQLSSEARRDRCLPNPAAAELARPWDLGGGDLNFRGIRNPAGAQGLRLLPSWVS